MAQYSITILVPVWWIEIALCEKISSLLVTFPPQSSQNEATVAKSTEPVAISYRQPWFLSNTLYSALGTSEGRDTLMAHTEDVYAEQHSMPHRIQQLHLINLLYDGAAC
jgi:hypothetical protein